MVISLGIFLSIVVLLCILYCSCSAVSPLTTGSFEASTLLPLPYMLPPPKQQESMKKDSAVD